MKRTNPHGSRRQLQGCFRITYGGPLQSILSGDLVVVALEHPTPWRPNALATQRPGDPTPWRSNAHTTQRPGDPTPFKRMLPSKKPTLGRPCRPARGAKIQACHPLAYNKSRPHGLTLSSSYTIQQQPPRGDPAFRVEQEMKGRRPKRPPFNQIRLPLQARAGNSAH